MSANPVIILRAARRDMVRYFAWLEAEAGTDTAERFMSAADQTFTKLAASPALAPKLGSANPAIAEMRKFPIEGFENMVVFYIGQDGCISVARIVHSASDWWALFDIDGNTP